MERKLASIQIIEALDPIEGADAIEVASILGWKVVVKKGEFKVGDSCVYCEIDSVLPERPEFEFLRAKHFRIKTMKLRGQISQGIAFPITILADASPDPLPIGSDVTELLGITKYEPPTDGTLRGYGRGNWPGFLRKTDEERIQTCKEVLRTYISTAGQWYVSEKLDGSSFTAYRKTVLDGEFDLGCCSRNTNLKLGSENDDNRFVQMYRKYNLAERLRELPKDVALQGELLGPGVQKNKYGFGQHCVRFFSVFDIGTFSYVPYAEFKAIIADLGLETVPILDESFSLLKSVDEMVQYSIAKSVVNPNIWREGVVIRRKDDSNVSFKVINPQFLLKFDE